MCSNAQAQELPFVYFDPAAGSAIQYKVRVRTLTTAWVYLSNYPHQLVVTHVELPSLPPEPYWIDVAAVGTSGHTGEWSDYIPDTADLNEDGMVTAGDFIVLSQTFGEPDRGTSMFLEMMTHWGDVTVWDATLEVRRYE